MSEETLGQYTLEEILGQPEAWLQAVMAAEAPARELRRVLYDVGEVVFCGCGSAFVAGTVVAPVYRQLTLGRARAVQAGDLVLFPQATLPDPSSALFVGLSRSGETTETVESAEWAKGEGAKVVAVTCNANSQLAKLADWAIILERAVERSVSATTSFTSLIVACEALSAFAAEDEEFIGQLAGLKVHGQRLLDSYGALGELLATEDRYERFTFAGSAHCYGLAVESRQLMREVTRQPCEACHVLEYPHGPVPPTDPGLHLTLLASDSAQQQEHEFLQEMKSRDANVLLLCESTEHPSAELADETVDVQSEADEFSRCVLYLPVIQLLAAHRAIRLGIDPDAPDEAPPAADEES